MLGLFGTYYSHVKCASSGFDIDSNSENDSVSGLALEDFYSLRGLARKTFALSSVLPLVPCNSMRSRLQTHST